MLRKKKPTFIIAFDATTQAMATDKFCTKNGLPGRLIPEKAAAMPHPEKESPPVRKAIIFLLSDYSIVRLLLFREAF